MKYARSAAGKTIRDSLRTRTSAGALTSSALPGTGTYGCRNFARSRGSASGKEKAAGLLRRPRSGSVGGSGGRFRPRLCHLLAFRDAFRDQCRHAEQRPAAFFPDLRRLHCQFQDAHDVADCCEGVDQVNSLAYAVTPMPASAVLRDRIVLSRDLAMVASDQG